jgi:site-specific DNA-methyltransferase (adenine-specific)
MRATNIEQILHDIKRIKSAVGNIPALNDLLEYLETGSIIYRHTSTKRYGVTVGTIKNTNTEIRIMKSIHEGCIERSIVEVPPVHYGSVHPTQKPVRLAERIIALISDVGDTIYDPFMGSGSFGLACLNTGRQYIGSELNEAYFNIALERIQTAQQQQLLQEVSNA